ncbi:hypothetical protein C7212DRAFT_314252, partial [Tuber magnatum]
MLRQRPRSGSQPDSLTSERRPALDVVNPRQQISIDRGTPYTNAAANFESVDRGKEVVRRKRLLAVVRVWGIFAGPWAKVEIVEISQAIVLRVLHSEPNTGASHLQSPQIVLQDFFFKKNKGYRTRQPDAEEGDEGGSKRISAKSRFEENYSALVLYWIPSLFR